MLCDIRVINKNPRYKVVQYNDEYLLIDLVSTWLVYFFPFINWFIPKNYAKLSEKELENLNVDKQNKNNIFWPVTGSSFLLVVILRKYVHTFEVQLENKILIALCFIGFIGIAVFYIYLNKKIKLKIYDDNLDNENKVILMPTFKDGSFIVFTYLLLGGCSILFLIWLLTIKPQNLLVFIMWIIITIFFFLISMGSISNKKVYAKLKKQ